MKLDKEFKSVFNKIEFSSKIKDDIKNNIHIKYRKYKRNKKIMLSICIVLSVAVISTGTLYAGDSLGKEKTRVSKHFYQTNCFDQKLYKFKLESRVRKELNYDAELNEPTCKSLAHRRYGFSFDCYSLYTYDEIENILGIKLLKSSFFRGDKFALYRILKNDDNKIGYLELKIPNYYYNDPRTNEKRADFAIDVSAMIKTKYEKNFSNTFIEFTINEDDEIRETFVNNLNVKAYIVPIQDSWNKNGERYIFFEYDDIIYRIRIVSMEFRGNELIDEEVQRIIDSIEK